MNSRKGMALILALLVTLVGGILITATFSFIYGYSKLAQMERVVYVDHTTLLSYVQEMKARIVSENVAQDVEKTRHVPEILLWHAGDPMAPNLTRANLRFGAAAGDGWSAWQVRESNVSTGVGIQRVEVDVYDMFFELAWVAAGELQYRDFPPTFRMDGSGSGGSGYGSSTGLDGVTVLIGGSVGGESAGGATTPGGGDSFSVGSGGLDVDKYGAYLIRARLYDNSDKLLRAIDEAFVQILP